MTTQRNLVAIGMALVLAGAWTTGCVRQLRAEESVVWQHRPGPTCYVRLVVDGETAIEVEAPFSCTPPPEFCAPVTP